MIILNKEIEFNEINVSIPFIDGLDTPFLFKIYSYNDNIIKQIPLIDYDFIIKNNRYCKILIDTDEIKEIRSNNYYYRIEKDDEKLDTGLLKIIPFNKEVMDDVEWIDDEPNDIRYID